MKKLIFILMIFSASAFFIKIAIKNNININLKSTAEVEAIDKSSILTKKGTDLQNLPNSSADKNLTYLPSKNIEKIKSEKPNTGYLNDAAQIKTSASFDRRAKIDTFNLNKFAKSKINESVATDLGSAVPFGNWEEGEVASLSGHFLGQSNRTVSNYQVRINLSESSGTHNLSPSSCVGFYNNGQIVFKEAIEGGKIKILKTPTLGYIILVVSDKFYVQLFLTREDKRRQIEVHITEQERKKPLIMKAKQIEASSADECALSN